MEDRFDIEGRVCPEGRIFRATDRSSAKPVAIRFLRRHAAEGYLAQFEREAAQLVELSHPGIVRYVAYGIVLHRPYLVMEWLEGEALENRLRRARLSVHETVALGQRLAEALDAAHSRGILHRNVGTTNILRRNP